MLVTLTDNVLIDVVRYEATSSVSVDDELGEDLISRGLAADGDAQVTYEANGGSGDGPAASVVALGTEITLSENTFTPPEGKVFTSWNTQAGGGGTSVNAGGKFTVSADTVFYAQYSDSEEQLSVQSVQTRARRAAAR